MFHRSSFFSLTLLGATLGSLIFVGALCTREQPMKVDPVTLEYWHVFDNESALQQIAENLRAQYPYITVNFRRFREEEYEDRLVNALAAGSGPDLFAIQDTWVGKYEDKVLPLPPELTIPTFTTEGGISKTTVAHPGKQATLRPWDVHDLFVDVVADTVIRNPRNKDAGTIIGLPLALDTIVLYVNRDLLSREKIPEPPTTWDELTGQDVKEGMIQKLTKTDVRGNIFQSAIALGGSTNIKRAPDILSLLMLQNNTPMTGAHGDVTFNQRSQGFDQQAPPAEVALDFYSYFSDPANVAYTWNGALPEALDAFTSNRTAMFFGYAYHLPLVRARAPQMNLVVKPMLQIAPDAQVNYANFWVTAVSKQTRAPNEAWKLLLFAATDREQAFAYAKTAARPVALRSLITAQRDDPEQEDMRVFVDAVLTAKNWYRGTKHALMEETFRRMIQLVVDRTKTPHEAIEFGIQRLRE
ncbi:extracellular solute-binding protein [Candidatus Uhrbacteria bacterium]|nr:extracellular solute-binding protein [Candidatus Uhrbacteria bacterium]